MATPISCARCGRTADEPQVTWSMSTENGRRVYYCDVCSRENLRSIEGRLDEEWWA